MDIFKKYWDWRIMRDFKKVEKMDFEKLYKKTKKILKKIPNLKGGEQQ